MPAYRPFLFALSLLTAVACAETRPCAENPDSPTCTPWICCSAPNTDGCDPMEVAERCEGDVDAGTMDAGRDAGRDGGRDAGSEAGPVDGGPCGEVCEDGTVCNAATGDCVQCFAEDESECTGDTPVCDTATNECVGCVDASHCTTPNASVCEDRMCVGCVDDGDCGFVPGGLDACDSGVCRECRVGNETACGLNSCDPATNTCTATPRGETPVCGACLADSECMPNHYCVPMEYDGTPNGSYCMRRVGMGDCLFFQVPLEDRESLSGEPSTNYCGIDEDSLSCGAVRGLLDSVECTGGDVGLCGGPGAVCVTLGVNDNRCSYACGTPAECPPVGVGSGCAAFHCGS
ncbi:MAG: hypothetical protein AB8I08_06165 [Sandaracinaceae bacterium]